MQARHDPRMKRLALTIAICGTALLVDRFVIGPPSEAAASPAVTAESTPVNAAGRPVAVVFPARPTPPDADRADARSILAERLVARTASGVAGAADDLSAVFADPADWWSVADVPALDPDEDPEGIRARFERDARLTAVINADDGLGGARINGRFVPLGGVIGGFRLVAIGSRSAVLAGSAGRVVLQMNGPVIGGEAAEPRRERW